MPSGLTHEQRSKIQQLCTITQAPERTVAKVLKTNEWNVELAINTFYAGTSANQSTALVSSLNKLFDGYRDDPEENRDGIGVEGSMKYLEDIKVPLDGIAVLVIGELLQAPTMGEFARDGFIRGWRSTASDTIKKQQSAVSTLMSRLPTDQDYFRRIYRYTFHLGRQPGQKAVSLEAAIEYWRLLFSPPHGASWVTPSGTPWLEWWITYLTERWKRTVNRDMWYMLYEFHRKTLQQEDLSWWDEQGAWPGVLDDFVGYVRERRAKEGGSTSNGDAAMVVE